MTSKDFNYTPREKRFVESYAKRPVASKAARDAGYSDNKAAQIGYNLLQKPKIKILLEETLRKHREQSELENFQLMEEYKRVAYANIAAIYDKKGRIRPVSELPEDVTCAIQEVDERILSTTTDDSGETRTVIQRKIKMHAKSPAMEALSRHKGFFETDNLQKTGYDFSGLSEEEMISLAGLMKKSRKAS